MAIYPPPIDNLPIFDTTQFENVDSTGNVIQAYVEFPVAQGDVILQDALVTGTLVVNSTLTAQDDLGVSGSLYANTINENTAGSLTIGNDAITLQFGDVANTTLVTIDADNTTMNGPLTMSATSAFTANGGITLGANRFITTSTNTIQPLLTQYGAVKTSPYIGGTAVFISETPKTYAQISLTAGVYILQGQGSIVYTTVGGLIYYFTTNIVNETTNVVEGTNMALSNTTTGFGPVINSTNAIVSITETTSFKLTMLVKFDAPSSFTPSSTSIIFAAVRIA